MTRRLTLTLGRTRPDMAEGCPERLGRGTWAFYRYIWETRASGRQAIARLAAGAACPVVRLASDRAAAAFLDGLG